MGSQREYPLGGRKMNKNCSMGPPYKRRMGENAVPSLLEILKEEEEEVLYQAFYRLEKKKKKKKRKNCHLETPSKVSSN